MSETKRCTVCGEEKPLSAFYRNRASRDGRQSHCRVCHRERCRAWHATHRERSREINAQYRAGHREQERERARRWYARKKQEAA